MTDDTIKNLEIEPCEAAYELRVNSKLTASEYKDSLFRLILLSFAENKYEKTKED